MSKATERLMTVILENSPLVVTLLGAIFLAAGLTGGSEKLGVVVNGTWRIVSTASGGLLILIGLVALLFGRSTTRKLDCKKYKVSVVSPEAREQVDPPFRVIGQCSTGFPKNLHIYVFLIDGANPTRYWAYGPADIEAGKWTQKIEDERWRPGRDHRYGVFIVGEEGQTLIHHYRVAARAILAVAPGADLPGIDRLTSDIVQCGSAFNIYRKETVTNKPDNDRDLAVSRTAKGETLFIDLRPFRGGNLEPLMLDYQNLTTVDDFLDKIFYSLSPRPRPHTYGVEWVLFNEANGHQYLELGSHWTKTRAMEADSRTLDEVGIRAGMRLSVRPPKVEAPPQASESQEILLSELKAQDRTGWYPDNPASWTFSDEGIGVTHSAIGGIFKRGNDWSNYEFSFEFRIIRDNGSWIVRASSLEHYVMIQCTADRIRPHIRRLQESGAVETTPIKPEGLPLKTELRLGQWATVRTDVNGSSIRVFVEGDEIWRDETFLSDFPTGSVGFRCSGHENAQFRKIRVRRLRT